jgi:hypothetical protein
MSKVVTIDAGEAPVTHGGALPEPSQSGKLLGALGGDGGSA